MFSARRGVSQDVLVTLAVVLVQAPMIIFSTKLVEMVNNAAVATEIIGIVGLTVVLAIAVIFGSDGSFSNLSSTGIVHDHWFTWLVWLDCRVRRPRTWRRRPTNRAGSPTRSSGSWGGSSSPPSRSSSGLS